MIVEAIAKVSNGENLDYDMAAAVMDEIMSGTATDAQKASFLTALHMKGETIDEITACASVMRKHCAEFDSPVEEELEIVGTGGDCAGTINISTIASIIVAAAGGKIAKHGNRAASSKCGAADCLEALGVNLMADREISEKALKEVGICFLFAQKYHTAMRFVGGVRKEIKIPTIFNILGPLANPANANLQLLGVYDEKLLEPLTQVLVNLGVKRAMAVHGEDGLDEITAAAKTQICEMIDGKLTRYTICPEDYGFTTCDPSELTGGTPEQNAQIARDILSGKIRDGKRTAVLMNAGAGLHLVKQIPIEEGIRIAAEALDSGKALETLEKFIAVTNS